MPDRTWSIEGSKHEGSKPGEAVPACAIMTTETNRLRIDEEYRFSNGTGWRSKDKRNSKVPGPQERHWIARGAGSNPEPADLRVDGAFQDAQEGSPLAQRPFADGGASPAFIGLPAQPQPGALQDSDYEPWHPPLTVLKTIQKRFSRAGNVAGRPAEPSSLHLVEAGRRARVAVVRAGLD